MIVLCGCSASGKDSEMNVLIDKYGYNKLVTYTTRPIREGEVEDYSYHYISDDMFDKLEKSGFFAESTSYHVATDEIWKYGTAKEDLTDDKIVILNPAGLKALKADKSLNIVAFHLFASYGEIWNRLRKRGDASDEAARRIEADKKDFADINEYIDFAIRTDSYLSVEEIADLIHEVYSIRKEN